MLSSVIIRQLDKERFRKFQKDRWKIRKKTRPYQVLLLLCLGGLLAGYTYYKGAHLPREHSDSTNIVTSRNIELLEDAAEEERENLGGGPVVDGVCSPLNGKNYDGLTKGNYCDGIEVGDICKHENFCKEDYTGENLNCTKDGWESVKSGVLVYDDAHLCHEKHCFDRDIENNAMGAAVFVYILVILYCFIALAVMCDEYFVASLEEISERLKLSDDVAGATFMASASSAPELFTNIADTFFGSSSNIGFGTIVGSAMFNILVIIAVSGIFSGGSLKVDWRPLARDCGFYLLSIVLLIAFFVGGEVTWYENFILMFAYGLYIGWMTKNEYLLWKVCRGPEPKPYIEEDEFKGPSRKESHVPKILQVAERARAASRAGGSNAADIEMQGRNSKTAIVPQLTNTVQIDGDNDVSAGAPYGGGNASGSRRSSSSYSRPFQGRGPNLRFRAAVTAVIVANRTLPQMRDDLEQRRSTWQANASAYPQSPHTPAKTRWIKATNAINAAHYWSKLPSPRESAPKLDRIKSGRAYAGIDTDDADDLYDEGDVLEDGGAPGISAGSRLEEPSQAHIDGSNRPRGPSDGSGISQLSGVGQTSRNIPDDDDDEEEDDDDTVFGKIINIISLPILFLFKFTVPDCATDRWKEWYPVTFTMSIIWIGVISHFMVEFAERIGCLVGIDPIIMGVTILAAGTSVPDALASVVAARAGSAGMAVSNAIGSNVFDIEIGLGFPWFIACFVYGTTDKSGTWRPTVVKVRDDELLIPVLMLFGTVILTVGILKIRGWMLSRFVGAFLFTLYILFVIYSALANEGSSG